MYIYIYIYRARMSLISVFAPRMVPLLCIEAAKYESKPDLDYIHDHINDFELEEWVEDQWFSFQLDTIRKSK